MKKKHSPKSTDIGKGIFIQYKSVFADRASSFFFWKGRVALYSILKCLEIKPGDEVIIPGFTCVVVANAIIYLGAKPVYADIDPITYNLTVETVKPVISPKTKVIIAQNTFGLSPDLNGLLALAEEKGLYLIEDCAHGLGGSYQNRPAGTVAHASFFSTQWSKPITTGLGGIAYVRDRNLAEKMVDFHRTLPDPNFSDRTLLALQLMFFPLINSPHLYYTLVNSYRYLTQKSGLPVGSSSGHELGEPQMPADYLKKMSPLQMRLFNRKVAKLGKKARKREEAWNRYDDFFLSKRKQLPYPFEIDGHSMLRYPIKVQNKGKVLHLAKQHKIPLGDWFVSPLHPVEGSLAPWDYKKGMCPQAEKACSEVINLFTDHPLSLKKMRILYDIIDKEMIG